MAGSGSPSDWRSALSELALLSLVTYIGVTVWRHSDAELINPETSISVPEFIDIASIPTGRIVAPLLDIELSIFAFYLVAPFVILAAHIVLVTAPGGARPGFAFSRRLALYLPAAVLLLLLWKFAPYMHARPDAVSISSAGRWLTRLHMLAVAFDTVVIAFGLLSAGAIEGRPPPASRATPIWRAVVAIKLAALFALPSIAIGWLVRSWLAEDPAPSMSLTITVATALGLVTAAVAGRQLLTWRPHDVERLTAGLVPSENHRQGSTLVMQIALAVALLLTPAVLLPEAPRPLDLTGARLFAREPSEALMGALIAATVRPHTVDDDDEADVASQLSYAKLNAWQAFGDGIDLSLWRFPGVSFQDASMQRIALLDADLRRANLIRANMTTADLTRAKIGGATLTEADLRGATLKEIGVGDVRLAADETSEASVDLSGANLTGADLSGAQLPRANLSGANLTNATISDADLQSADLSGAILTEATISRADLRRADLAGAILIGAKIAGAQLQGADLSAADLTRVQISTETNLNDADLRNATLHDVSFQTKNLERAKIAGTDFCGADLAGADLSQADWLTPKDDETKQAKPSFEDANLDGTTLPHALADVVLQSANIRNIRFAEPKQGDKVLAGNVKVDLSRAQLMNVRAIGDFKSACKATATVQ